MTPDKILQFGFGGLAVLFAAVGFLSKQHRFAWWTAGASAAVAGISAHYDAFWVMATGGLAMIWALVCTTNTIDLAWRAKAGLTLAVGLGAFLCVWPTLEGLSGGKLPCPAYVKDHIEFRLVAGLDLRGGLRLVYTVDVEEAIKDKRDRYFDDIRAQLATEFGFHTGDKDKAITREELNRLPEKVDVEKSRSSVAVISVKMKDAADVSKLDALSQKFNTELVRQPGPDANTVYFKIRTDVETSIRERAVNQAKDTIGRRVDELGLREAAVTVRDEDIIIEVPGEDEKSFKEIREIISKTARLEFKMVDDSVDFFHDYAQAQGDEKKNFPVGIRFGSEDAPVGPGKTNRVTHAQLVKQPNETMKQARDRFREWLSSLNPPTDHEIGLGVMQEADEQGVMQDIGYRTYYLYGKAEVTGDQITDAQATPDQSNRSTGGWYVQLKFTQTGATRFEEITGANVQKRFAIILDDIVESAPRILSKIGGGTATITMGQQDPQKQLEESRKLELVLRSGALPAPITPSNEQRIGASLGSDAIKKGIYGALAGSGLVLLFMAFYYHVAGFVADMAVLFNLFLQISILATFGAAMTLPGIAGLALTIGMAIDANVLINERIREELRHGKTARAAVDVGYDKALSAIIDGHMTTFISGLILAQYGTGPIKGFAVTLLVGMLVSLFTSVVCTRLAFDWWVRGRKVKQLNLGLERKRIGHGALQARPCVRLHGDADLLGLPQHLPNGLLDLPRHDLPGPELRNGLQGRHRSRDRVQEADRRRQGARGRERRGIRESGRRRSGGSGEPEPLPHPRAGSHVAGRGAQSPTARGALLRGGRQAAPGRSMPRDEARHGGEVQPRRRQDRDPLRDGSGSIGDQDAGRIGERRGSPHGAEQPADRQRPRSQSGDRAQERRRQAGGWARKAARSRRRTGQRVARRVGRPEGGQAAPRRSHQVGRDRDRLHHGVRRLPLRHPLRAGRHHRSHP